jgi:carbonic anhydrase
MFREIMSLSFPAHLMQGYGRYLSKGFVRYKETQEHLAVYGQTPEVMVMSCCDSRVTPEGIFGAGPGELFVVRNVANLVPPFEATEGQHGTSAAIEYGVTEPSREAHRRYGALQVRGHPGLPRKRQSGPLRRRPVHWALDQAAGACRDRNGMYAGRQDRRSATGHGICRNRQSLKNLMTFPFVKEAVDRGELQLHGAWFDIGSAELRVMDAATERFETADGPEALPIPTVAAE